MKPKLRIPRAHLEVNGREEEDRTGVEV